MLSDFIKNLQQKPESSKMKILYFSAALTIVLVLMIWVSSFGEYKAAFNNPANSDIVNSLKASIVDPLVKVNENQDLGSKIQSSNKETEKQRNEETNPESRNQNPENVGVGGANPALEAVETENQGNDLNSDFSDNIQEENKVFRLPVE